MSIQNNDSKTLPKKNSRNEHQSSDAFDIEQVHQDFYELFTTNPNKDMLKYAYNDPAVYDAVTKSPDYYLFREEAELINHNKSALTKYLQNIETVIELGPGSENALAVKTIPLLKCAPHLKKYVAVDISQDYLNEIGNYIKSNTNFDVELIKADFVNDQINMSNNSKQKAIMMLGSTIGGFDNQEREKCLNNISHSMNKGDIFILSVDTNKDPITLIKAYNQKANTAFIMEILNFYAKLNCSFQRYLESFDITVTWSDETKCVNNYVSVTKNFTFNIHNHGDVNLHSGQEFQIVRSRKFTEEEMLLYFEGFNCKIVNILRLGYMRLFILEKQ